MQLFTAVCSSAGIERLFSSFGFIHSKSRNRLGVEKCSKLVTIFKHLNKFTICIIRFQLFQLCFHCIKGIYNIIISCFQLVKLKEIITYILKHVDKKPLI
ncbi:Dimer Tnp hAT domain-containing protein [Aphis craccivora]|uniref:Dimer Tnp hAT domain-containing protein n=1 Tax=Aphis craccivora TaxID=307492 RepID=A0A6G0W1G2_APHCR|nr:Dimer Tnp hAT domain-containing protein [Aphis craccivora]